MDTTFAPPHDKRGQLGWRLNIFMDEISAIGSYNENESEETQRSRSPPRKWTPWHDGGVS